VTWIETTFGAVLGDVAADPVASEAQAAQRITIVSRKVLERGSRAADGGTFTTWDILRSLALRMTRVHSKSSTHRVVRGRPGLFND